MTDQKAREIEFLQWFTGLRDSTSKAREQFDLIESLRYDLAAKDAAIDQLTDQLNSAIAFGNQEKDAEIERLKDEIARLSGKTSYCEQCEEAGKTIKRLEARVAEFEKGIAEHKEYTYACMGGAVHLGDLDLWELINHPGEKK